MSNATATPAGFEVSNWKPYSKNTLLGFCSLTMPSGMVLHGITYHVKADKRWVGLPAREFAGKNGEKSWSPMVEIPDRDTRDRFNEQACAAIDRFLGAQK